MIIEFIKNHFLSQMICAAIGAVFGIIAFIAVAVWDDAVRKKTNGNGCT